MFKTYDTEDIDWSPLGSTDSKTHFCDIAHVGAEGVILMFQNGMWKSQVKPNSGYTWEISHDTVRIWKNLDDTRSYPACFQNVKVLVIGGPDA